MVPFLVELVVRLGNDKTEFYNFNARLMIRSHIIYIFYVLFPTLTSISDKNYVSVSSRKIRCSLVYKKENTHKRLVVFNYSSVSINIIFFIKFLVHFCLLKHFSRIKFFYFDIVSTDLLMFLYNWMPYSGLVIAYLTVRGLSMIVLWKSKPSFFQQYFELK